MILGNHRHHTIDKRSAKTLKRLNARYGDTLKERIHHGGSRIVAGAEEIGSRVRQRPLATFAIVAASALALGTLAGLSRRERHRHGWGKATRH